MSVCFGEEVDPEAFPIVNVREERTSPIAVREAAAEKGARPAPRQPPRDHESREDGRDPTQQGPSSPTRK